MLKLLLTPKKLSLLHVISHLSCFEIIKAFTRLVALNRGRFFIINKITIITLSEN